MSKNVSGMMWDVISYKTVKYEREEEYDNIIKIEVQLRFFQ